MRVGLRVTSLAGLLAGFAVTACGELEPKFDQDSAEKVLRSAFPPDAICRRDDTDATKLYSSCQVKKEGERYGLKVYGSFKAARNPTPADAPMVGVSVY